MPDELKRYRRELKKFYKQTKSTKVCEKCGAKKYLQYHHREPRTKICSVARMVHNGVDKEILVKEMDKCVVLCRSCHCRLHAELKKRNKN